LELSQMQSTTSVQSVVDIQSCDYQAVRQALLDKREVAFLDVREEDPHAQSHPLFAANFPLSRVELDAYSKLPRRDVWIVTIDEGDVPYAKSDAMRAALRLASIGFTNISVFKGGVGAWSEAGGELFIDVNVPSKSFGEFVEAHQHTPSLSAQEVKALIDEQADVVIVDARRFDEYNTMSIPTAISCPGAELVLRIAELAPRPETRVIVNCAGRTRSIIGTQSLINAGIPNKVSALRNGTIGWTLAEQVLDKGQTRKFSEVSAFTTQSAATRARSVADRAGVKRATLTDVHAWRTQSVRSTYFFDTRNPEEYVAGHLPGFRSTPGGQLVQETEMVAPVRGARLVLADTDGVRANMTASWLAQMAWDVYVLDGVGAKDFNIAGAWHGDLPPMPQAPSVTCSTLATWLRESAPGKETIVIDFARHAQYVQGHIPAARYVLRSQLTQALAQCPNASRYVLTCPDGVMARFALNECAQAFSDLGNTATLSVLEGGTQAWRDAGLDVEKGPTHLVSVPIDRYKRPYEGTNNAREAMQGYLDWEFGLVEQLGRDGTHHFWVL
jgi:rhodanese-related sulfurtransferase